MLVIYHNNYIIIYNSQAVSSMACVKYNLADNHTFGTFQINFGKPTSNPHLIY